MRLIAMLLFLTCPALAEGEKAGVFDYYILSLSWSPTYCTLEGDARGARECEPHHDHGFTLHGLWPQFESGWPSYCRTNVQDPSRSETAAMADVMGSGGLAWHEWKKHGRCSGLSASTYFSVARDAYESIAVPAVLSGLQRDVKVPAKVIEEAFINANPGLTPPMITITCKAGMIQEARICLTKNLTLRACSADAARDCRMPDALMEAVR